MKKAQYILAAVTALVLVFTVCFFLISNLSDGAFIIRAVTPTSPAPTAPATTVTQGPININTATKEELMSLPGIGATYAARIIAYRDANGPFTNITQLLNVKGIGEKRLEAIIDLITIGG